MLVSLGRSLHLKTRVRKPDAVINNTRRRETRVLGLRLVRVLLFPKAECLAGSRERATDQRAKSS